jgi:hypothetical protein
MAFNSGVGIITPNIMKQLVQLYNRAPHKTLSKILGFPVTPDIAESDPTIETELIKRLTSKNNEIRSKVGFKLHHGDSVAICNAADSMLKRGSRVKPELRTVQSFNGILYTLLTPSGRVEKQSRFKIKPI